MKARLGIAPIAWTNDDLPELGGDTPLEVCLSESREAGFSGTETGGKFPRTSRELKEVLAAHDLKLVSGWYSGLVLENELSKEKDRAYHQLELFRDNGATVIVYGETTGTVQNKRDVALARRPRLDDEQMRAYGRKLTQFAEYCAEQGVPLSFHHHMATAIETEDDVDRLMNFTGEAVGLLFDTGHITFAGGDPLRMGRRHGARINHVHAKDIRQNVLRSLDFNKSSFLDAVLAGVFTVPGDGMIDFKRVAALLADIRYEGWVVVEAEQDPAKAPPLKYAKIGYEALSEALDQAGYTIEG
ncbi:MAG: myo-inosose-2 dehydratase [Pseudomonadota bacterium]|nr:myo-inosose-2 dehydratase [Pseudomonadota bacterium]